MISMLPFFLYCISCFLIFPQWKYSTCVIFKRKSNAKSLSISLLWFCVHRATLLGHKPVSQVHFATKESRLTILNTQWLCLSIKVIFRHARVSSLSWVLDVEISCSQGAGPTNSLLHKTWRQRPRPWRMKAFAFSQCPVVAGHICTGHRAITH